jgi:starch synthase (maltosyl-transferring)
MPETSRILYVDPLSDAPALSATAAALGFSHVLMPPPWSPSANGDRFAPATLDGAAVASAASLGTVAGAACLLDVQINRLASGTGTALGQGLFQAGDPHAALDPRQTCDLEADTAHPQDAGAATALGRFWGQHFAEWHKAGATGFRLLGLDGLRPELLGGFLAAIRQSAPDAALYAWAPGLTREAMRDLAGHGLAGIFSSFAWWDMRADWFWAELDVLRQAGPVIHAPEAPHATRIRAAPQDHADEAVLYRRAASLAATLGQGWMALASAGAENAGLMRNLNALSSGLAALSSDAMPVLPAGMANPVLAVLRTDAPDRRYAQCATVTLVNADSQNRHSVDPAILLTSLGGRFASLQQRLPPGGDIGLARLVLGPAESAVFVAEEAARPTMSTRVEEAGARRAAAAPRLAIEAVSPSVDGGAFPVKLIAGESADVSADIVFDGHEKIAGALRWRAPGAEVWQETALRPLGNDRWQAAFALTQLGRYEYIVLAWRDVFETFRDELAKKHAAGVDISLELQEGVALIARFAESASRETAERLRAIIAGLAEAGDDHLRETLLSAPVARLMADADPRPFAVETAAMPIDAERLEARFASWYEVFPRSLSDDPARHGTFDDVIRHLPRIAAMGFDVLYFPPIHPIGRKNRKGRNNSLTPAESDPGSPYAIGSEQGGHDALHPELGTFESFRRLRESAAAHGLELAIDFAVQCAPDHPWLREHPGWFDWRPDGTIKYAENPPKKYEDIVNVDFYASEAIPGLWLELCRVVLFWAGQGVRLFRVDNPHTKPFPFWEWMIGEVRQRYPDAIFLAEAFTRPKIMYRLAKIGFSQSYTYFTWRNSKKEITDYSTELATEAPKDFFRPHFFVNTPDINPVFLQVSGRPGFLIRAALAATLSGLWGVYNGFELCEAAPVPGKEEYLDSEKYQLRAWDWDRPGNIVADITLLNRLRRENPALQTHLNVKFHNAFNDTILYFEKATADRSNVVLVAISLDPHQAQEADYEIPLWEWGLRDDGAVAATDLLTGDQFAWYGKMQHLRLTPERPYAIWRVSATRDAT